MKHSGMTAQERQVWARLAREPQENYYDGLRTFNLPRPDNIILFGRGSHRQSYYAVHHRHVLVFNLGMDGAFYINHELVPFPENSLLLICPFQYHYVESSARKLAWLYITFEMPENPSLAGMHAQPRRITGPIRQRMLDCLVTYFARRPDTERANELALRLGLLLNILPHAPAVCRPNRLAGRRVITLHHYQHSQMISKLNQYILAHFSGRLTAPTLAAAVGFSASHLRLVFRRQMHISLGRYIRLVRIQHATEMLKNSTQSIKEIAAAAGFTSLSSFDQTFRREIKTTPAAYRAQGRRNQ